MIMKVDLLLHHSWAGLGEKSNNYLCINSDVPERSRLRCKSNLARWPLWLLLYPTGQSATSLRPTASSTTLQRSYSLRALSLWVHDADHAHRPGLSHDYPRLRDDLDKSLGRSGLVRIIAALRQPQRMEGNPPRRTSPGEESGKAH